MSRPYYGGEIQELEKEIEDLEKLVALKKKKHDLEKELEQVDNDKIIDIKALRDYIDKKYTNRKTYYPWRQTSPPFEYWYEVDRNKWNTTFGS